MVGVVGEGVDGDIEWKPLGINESFFGLGNKLFLVSCHEVVMDGLADEGGFGLELELSDTQLTFKGQVSDAGFFFDFAAGGFSDGFAGVWLYVAFRQDPHVAALVFRLQEGNIPLSPFFPGNNSSGR